jgi:hypothetical protein
LGAAVPGGVDRDDLETHQTRRLKRLGVQEPLSAEAVDHHERDAAPGDRDADLVPVGQHDAVAGEPWRSDRNRVERHVVGDWPGYGFEHLAHLDLHARRFAKRRRLRSHRCSDPARLSSTGG